MGSDGVDGSFALSEGGERWGWGYMGGLNATNPNLTCHEVPEGSWRYALWQGTGRSGQVSGLSNSAMRRHEEAMRLEELRETGIFGRHPPGSDGEPENVGA